MLCYAKAIITQTLIANRHKTHLNQRQLAFKGFIQLLDDLNCWSPGDQPIAARHTFISGKGGNTVLTSVRTFTPPIEIQ